MSDLDEAVKRHRTALLRHPPCGMMSDLDEAIELHQAVLLLLPLGHSYRSSCLNNLGLSLRDRFLQRGMMSDLDEAIKLHCAALLLHPPGHSD
ncbi:uncharacterized protein F5147DRAFT_778659 [Suillus discolor]|uniref:Uncharacterized protein n=1 Tax=Suillus discolor TaxID=1912936 RepID=A0A9P7JPC7_9AGAM|nr:uncharacterized protein F5147DRAFT_778659 [Suillus discolor]KAG2095437.1 hypothetical protein F5147DRAFT_778659 [Suillus discolor]